MADLRPVAELKPGDVVSLSCGGPMMTVMPSDPLPEGKPTAPITQCIWFNGDKRLEVTWIATELLIKR